MVEQKTNQKAEINHKFKFIRKITNKAKKKKK